MNKIKKTFLKEKENDYKLRNPKIFSKYVIVLSKNNPNIKFTFIDIVFFLIVIFYISLNYDSLIISNGVHKDEIKEKGIERVSKSYEAICNYIQSELKW